MVSLLAFMMLAGEGVRSFRIWDSWGFGIGRGGVDLVQGRVLYTYEAKATPLESPHFVHVSVYDNRTDNLDHLISRKWIFAGFSVRNFGFPSGQTYIVVAAPLWFPLLLLLVVPVRWLVAQPTNAPAFPVLTDAKRDA